MNHNSRNLKIFFEELEYGFNNGSNPVSWDSMSWYGGDWNRVWLKTEGETSTTEREGEVEAQLLYSRLIAPFWEFQVGVRGDLIAGENIKTDGRGFLVLGFEGLAPYWFWSEARHFYQLSRRYFVPSPSEL
ncbi:MAG: copper resistance protein B [Polyangiales bacterium]